MARKKKKSRNLNTSQPEPSLQEASIEKPDSVDWPHWYRPWSFRREWKYALWVAAIVGSVYLATAPRTVTLADSGMFISSCYFWGVSHPPGYPLHGMLGKLFTMLPAGIGSVAFRVGLLSMVFGVATCVSLLAVARSIRIHPAAAIATAILFGLSKTFWSQAIVAEVYTMHTFFIFMLLWGSLHFRATGSRRVLFLLAFGLGLSMANHWPFTLLSVVGLMWILLPQWRVLLRTLPVTTILFVLAAAVPYAVLVWRSRMDPEISFYGPLENWIEIKRLILRQGIRGIGIWVPRTPDDRNNFLLFFNQQFLIQITYVGAVFAMIGWVRQWRMLGSWNALALVVTVFLNSYFLVFWMNPNYNYHMRALWFVFPITAYGILLLWFGMGLDGCLHGLCRRWPKYKKWIAVMIPGLLCLLVFSQNVQSNYRRKDEWAHRYAKAILDSVAENGVYFSYGELDIGPLAYLHLVEGYRSDVTVYNAEGIVFNNRLFRPPESSERVKRILSEFVDSETRSIYYMVNIPHRYGYVDYGLFKRVNKTASSGKSMVTLPPDMIDYFLWVSRQTNLHDPWDFMHRRRILGEASFILHWIGQRRPDLMENPKVLEILDCADQLYLGRIGKIRALWEGTNPKTLIQWLEEAEKMDMLTLGDVEKSELYFRKAGVYLQLDEVENARVALRKSVRLFPTQQNQAVVKLLILYAMSGQKSQYRSLREKIFLHDKVPPELLDWDGKMGYVAYESGMPNK